jgi:hypothetical protein
MEGIKKTKLKLLEMKNMTCLMKSTLDEINK